VVLCLLTALMPASARAATFTVTSELDAAGNCAVGSPTCTLRQAIDDANFAPDHDDETPCATPRTSPPSC